uniref:C2H2-type domain-containing protein n=1 Tax=Mesocestoides corti TaxID=53468 RepID=A0A0R3UHQ7_MESCO
LHFFKTHWLIFGSKYFTSASFITPLMASVRSKPAAACSTAVTSSQAMKRLQMTQAPSNDPTTVAITCPLCSTVLRSKSLFLHHLGTEHEDSFFAVCKTCAQCFAPQEINAHVASCKGTYICSYCRQTFALLSYLNRHVSRKHAIDQSKVQGGRRYSCKFCSKTYSSNNSLNNHMKKHLECVCGVCGHAIVCESHKDYSTCGNCGNRVAFNNRKS